MNQRIEKWDDNSYSEYHNSKDGKCTKTIDYDETGCKQREIIYFYNKKNVLLGWTEISSSKRILNYLIDKSPEGRFVLVFDQDGKIVESSKYDEDE